MREHVCHLGMPTSGVLAERAGAEHPRSRSLRLAVTTFGYR
jgi:hypothetical protein